MSAPVKSTRRDLFTAGAATVLTGIAAASFVQPETLSGTGVTKRDTLPDAHVIALCASYDANRVVIEKLELEPAFPFRHPETERQEREADDAVDREHKILRHLAEVRARSSLGIAEKARVVRDFLPRYTLYHEANKDDVEMRVVFGLLDDIAEHASILRDLTA